MNLFAEPNDADPAEVLAVDAALTALADQQPAADPLFAALAEFAHSVEVRATRGEYGRPMVTGWHRASLAPSQPRPARRRRVTLRRTLLAVPVAAVTVLLVGMLPVNASPSSPLHDLHNLLFQPGEPSAAERVRASLAGVAQALDDAEDCADDDRAEHLDRARHDLRDAREWLARVEDPAVRADLAARLADLERRAAEPPSCDEDATAGDDQGDQGQDGQDEDDQGGHGTTPPPTNPTKNDEQPNPPGNDKQ